MGEAAPEDLKQQRALASKLVNDFTECIDAIFDAKFDKIPEISLNAHFHRFFPDYLKNFKRKH